MSVLWAFLAEPPCKFEIALPTYFMALHITMKRNRMLTEDHLYHDTYGCKWTVNLTVVLGMGPLVPWLFLSSLGWSNAEQLLQVVGAPSTCFVLFCFDLAPCSHIAGTAGSYHLWGFQALPSSWLWTLLLLSERDSFGL